MPKHSVRCAKCGAENIYAPEYWIDFGKRMNIDGPVLLISGWAHPADSMAPLAEALGACNASCLSVNDLGAGHEHWAARVRRRIATFGEPPLVIGWSIGGMLAFDALSGPDAPAAAGLVLMSASLRFCAAPHWPAGLPEAELRALRTGLRRDAESALRGFLAECAAPATPDPAALDRAVTLALEGGTDSLAEGLAWLADADLTGRRPPAGLRMLCAHGERDRIIPCAASRSIAERFRIRLAIFPDSGHSLVSTAPDRLAGAIRSEFDSV